MILNASRRILFIVLTLVSGLGFGGGVVWGQVNVFTDDFSTNTSATFTTSGAIGSSAWSVNRSGDDWGARRNTSPAQLELTNDATPTGNVNGWVFASVSTLSFSSPYNPILNSNTGILTWSFNMRQYRTDPAGFGAGSYGVAFILGGTETSVASNGYGYAVVLGQSGTTDPIRLVKYNNGLQVTLTNIITSNTSGLTDFGLEYLSIKVTYDPSSNKWELFLRNDGSSAFADPLSGTLTSQGTAIDNTYTSSSLGFSGGYWQGSTAANQTAFFDNVKVTVTPTPTLTLSEAILSGLTYVAGSGPSLPLTYTISGNNLSPLDGTISVNGGLTNYDVSTDGIAFAGSATIDYMGGSFTNKTVYVRLKAGLAVGYYNGEQIVNSGGAASSATVTCNGNVTCAIPIYSLGTAITEDFNSLENNGTSSMLPCGWYFSETLSNANTSYSAGDGNSGTGDTYSYGTVSDGERAFGTLLSSSLVSTIGAQYQNKTGDVINSLTFQYTGEQWRLGATGRLDRLDFQISFDANNLTTGTWFDYDLLDFVSPVNSGTVGPLIGNNPPNKTIVSSALSGTSIFNNSTFWMRWNDYNSLNADDGLAVDDFIVTASNICIAPNVQVSNITAATPDGNTINLSWTNGNGYKRIVIINTVNSFTNPLNGTDPSALASYSGIGEQVVYNGSGSTCTVTDLIPNTQYCFRVYEYNCSDVYTLFLTSAGTNNPTCFITPVCGVNVTAYSPASGSAGTRVSISGSNMTGGTIVTFNGLPTVVSFVSASLIIANVPVGATTGPIRVSDGCNAINIGLFTVINISCSIPVTDLFISEYIEGSSTNKAIEIANFTGSAKSLSGYSIEMYFNGSTSSSSVPLDNVSLANNQVWVVAPENASAALKAHANQISTLPGWFNGDDAVVLQNGIILIDIFGNIGCDPGSGWTGIGYQTNDRTLVRNSNILNGITSNPGVVCEFPTLTTDWTQFAQDDFTHLGSHTVDNSGIPAFITSQPSSNSVCAGSVVSFPIVATGAISYQWKYYEGTNWVNVVDAVGIYSGAQTTSLTITGATSLNGLQYYCEVFSTPTCFVASNAFQLTVYQLPVVTVSNNSPFCEGSGPLNFIGGPVGTYTYTWAGPNSFSSAVAAPSIASPTPADNGTYTLTVTDDNTCSASASTIVSITALPVNPGLTATSLCEGDLPSFTATGGSIYEFLVNGEVKQAASTNNTFTLTEPLEVGKDVCVRSYTAFSFTGIPESKWGNPLATSVDGPASTFGDNRINALYFQSNSQFVFIKIAGKLLDDAFNNKVLLFIDCQPGIGYNSLNWFPRDAIYLSVSKLNSGTTLDAGFEPDYILGINHSLGDVYYDLYHMADNTKNYLGSANTSNLLGYTPNSNSNDYSQGFEFAIPLSSLGNPSGNIKLFAMLVNDPGFVNPNTLLSNQFLTPAESGDNNDYGIGAVVFGNAKPDPISTALLSSTCYSETCLGVTAEWTGTTSSSWDVNSNWGCGAAPNSLIDVIIPSVPSGGQMPLIGSSITADCRNIEIQSGATLTIQSDAVSSGSLITNGTSSGPGIVTYNRYQEAEKWHILSSPLYNTGDQTSLSFANVAKPGSTFNVAEYDEFSNEWIYQPVLPIPFAKGKGYVVKLSTGYTNVGFTGTLNTTLTDVAVQSTGGYYGWNSVGNPFTSSLKITEDLNGFIDVNAAVLESSYSAIYLWSADASGYKVISKVGYTPKYGFGSFSDAVVQAGQGFLINVKSPQSGDAEYPNGTIHRAITFNHGSSGMQVHSTATTLKKSEASWPGITLLATNNCRTRSTIVAFNGKMATGLDPSYDAGLLSVSDFNLHTHLVAGGNETNFTIQCLPDTMYSTLSVPVGIDLPQPGTLTFKVAGVILPEGIYPVIEDRLLQLNTPLKTETDSLTVDIAVATRGTGRFYLHFGGTEINTGINIMPESPAFTARYANQQITLFGLTEQGSRACLYDINGRKLSREYQLTSANQNEIPATGLSPGIYLLKIECKTYRQTLKITILNQ